MNEIKVHVVDYGRKYFQMRYVDPLTGRQRTRSTRVPRSRRREAERVAAKWEHDLREGRYKELSKISWAEFRDRYEQEALAAKAPATAVKVSGTFNAVERILQAERLAAITSDQISRFQKQLRDEGLAESTIASHLRHLKAALRWAARKKLLTEVPDIDIHGGHQMKGRPITTEEFERMLAKVPAVVGNDGVESWECLLRGLWWSGLRLGEALNLSWTDDRLLCVDFSGRRPMFRIQAAAHKSRKGCILPMAPEFAEFLRNIPEAERSDFVFNPRSRRLSGNRPRVDTISKKITQIGRLAGIKVSEREKQGASKVKYASAHDIRRAFGLRWANLVMPPVLQQLMRHGSISTTIEFYLGRNAEAASDVLWDAVGNTSGNTCPSAAPPADPGSTQGRDATGVGGWGRQDSNLEPTDYESAALTD